MQITIDELKEKIKSGNVNIIDIRSNYLYSNGHILRAVNIPSEVLMKEPERYLKSNQIYYIYCQHGSTSQKVAHILNSRGYHTYSIIGGYSNYLLWK